MNEVQTGDFHLQLLDRRQKLESARAMRPDVSEVTRLLREVDAALERIETRTYGLCAVCHDPIEPDRLAADPLLTFCLDHLSAEQKRALQEDLDLASRIQSTLLPERHLRAAGWEACYHYEPAGPVSGDFCDLLRSGAGLFFLTGDVSGKGVASSLLMSQLHAIFRTLLSLQLPVRQLVERANRLFCASSPPSSYATLVCGECSPAGDVELCIAGHCPPLLLRDQARPIDPTGLPLGLFCEARYDTLRLHMDAGDTLVLYTDGLTEARNRAGEEYGAERLSRTLTPCRHSPPGDMVGKVLAELAAFLAGSGKTDDLTVFILQRLPAAVRGSA